MKKSNLNIFEQNERKIHEMGLALEELSEPHVQSHSLVINRALDARIKNLEAERRERLSNNSLSMAEILGKMNPDTKAQEPRLPVKRTVCPKLYE